MELETLLKTFQDKGIERIKVGGFDVDGVLRGKSISRTKFAGAAKDGFGFCDVIFGWDSADTLYDKGKYTGWHTGYPDTLARIDLSSFRTVPWEHNTAMFLLDFYKDEKTPLAISP